MVKSFRKLNTRSKTKTNRHHRSNRHKHSKNCKYCHQSGGGCGCNSFLSGGRRRRRTKKIQMKGGMLPPALVGSPWTAKINDWPGVGGIDGQTNYLALNKYHVDPQTQGIIQERDGTLFPYKGGKRIGLQKRRKNKTHSRRIRKTGGGIIPQDLVNVGRNVMHGIGNSYNTFNGNPTQASPLPYKDQLPNTFSSNQLRSTY